MKPESSLPCLQEPPTGPYPEPDESIPHIFNLLPSDPLQYYHSICV